MESRVCVCVSAYVCGQRLVALVSGCAWTTTSRRSISIFSACAGIEAAMHTQGRRASLAPGGWEITTQIYRPFVAPATQSGKVCLACVRPPDSNASAFRVRAILRSRPECRRTQIANAMLEIRHRHRTMACSFCMRLAPASR